MVFYYEHKTIVEYYSDGEIAYEKDWIFVNGFQKQKSIVLWTIS